MITVAAAVHWPPPATAKTFKTTRQMQAARAARMQTYWSNKMPNPWTAERIALLRRLWADGETAAAIAERLGDVSRSAVLGKVFRLRLRTKRAADDLEPGQGSVAGNGAAAPARRRRSSTRGSRPRIKPARGTQHKTLLELTNSTCRWPHGRPGTSNFFFCGTPEADLERGIPYCAKHMQRAYPGGVAIAQNAGAASSGASIPTPAAAGIEQSRRLVISNEQPAGRRT
jgi:GcrA cell cycle regulator